MKTIVITGSTRGIGFGLAQNFWKRDCSVMINGRTQQSVDEGLENLSGLAPSERLSGFPCDVRNYEQIEALWETAKKHFGHIDIWINNAGLAHGPVEFWNQTPEQINNVINVNMTGTLYGTRVALLGLREQGGGFLYNMEGLGSRGGQMVAGMALYGTTKAGLSYFDDAMMKECEGTPVKFGALLPGMVVTDMLVGQRMRSEEEWERTKRIFNILADRVETVTPWLVDQMLANDRNGVRISWLTRSKVMMRFLMAPFSRRNVVD